ncbi:MAG: VWA domain-containing protein [Kiritimatiellae bacterium]|nr:VWA domain-containing protein [Kiritimatiellia bacterium]
MTFLNELMLFGLLSLIIPLIILLLYRKRIVLNWAAYSWMKLAKQKKHKRTIVEDILKLIAKLLLLLMLVLFLSRPAIISTNSNKNLIVIDTTLSMGTIIENETRLSKAKKAVSLLLQNSNMNAALYSFDGKLIPLAKLGSKITPEIIDSLELSPRAARFDDLINSLSDLTELKKFNAIYFFSDFQKEQYKVADTIQQAVSRLGNCKFIMCPVDIRPELENAGLKNFSPRPEGFFPGRNNQISVTVRNYSSVKMDNIPVTLKVNGKACDRTIVNLLPNSEETVNLNVSVVDRVTAKVTVEIPPDAFLIDNKLNIVVDPPKKLDILAIVKDKGEALFEYDVFFANAIKAFSAEDYINYKRISPSQVYEESLDNYNMVITFGVPFSAKSGITTAIKNYLKKDNKALIAFSDLTVKNYWQELGIKDGKDGATATVADKTRLKDSYLSFMEGGEIDPAMISFLRYRTIPLSNGKGNVGRMYLAGQPDPVIIKAQRGNNNLVLAGFMPYLEYSNMFYNPNFIQLTMRILTDAMNLQVFHSYMGDAISSVPLINSDLTSNYQLSTPTEGNRQMAAYKDQSGSLFLSAQPMVINTFCDVLRDDKPFFRFGYNATREDSAIEPLSDTELSRLKNDQISYTAKQEIVLESAETEYLAIMALLFLLALIFDNYVHFWRKQ